MAAVTLSVLGLFPDSSATDVEEDVEALAPAAQVRIFAGGRQWSGTLVARNWVLTADHGEWDGTGGHLIFGEINDANDGTDQTHRRDIAPHGIVRHPNRVDLALVHFAEPVPEDTWIPDLAAGPPHAYAPAHSYGWNGGILGRVSTTILRPSAFEAFWMLRDKDPRLIEGFTEAAPPMATNVLIDPGDSGGGTFSPWGVLAGIHVNDLDFVYDNASGGQNRTFLATFEQPVWRYREWILSVINGPAPSSATPTPSPAGSPASRPSSVSGGGGLGGRVLAAVSEGELPMTLPPQTDRCDPGMASCSVSEPAWVRGVLLGSGNYRGTALARCASAGGDGCSFDGVASAAGASKRLQLGPSSTPTAPGTREVMVWCKTSTAFPDAGSPTRPVLRVSFTNGDPKESPLGYGWWDVTPEQVGTGTGQTLVDTTPLAPC